MRLTQYSDFGLRLLMYLALRQGEPVTIQEVSERFDISRNHLVKISYQLTRNGLIKSTRGRNGGISLARAAESITVEQALIALEENFALVECFAAAPSQCAIAGACRLGGVLNTALEAFFGVLRGATLADLVRNGAELELRLAAPVRSTNVGGGQAGSQGGGDIPRAIDVTHPVRSV